MLNAIHADEYVLYHMTGMKQTKQEYIDAIADGTLNYFSAEHDRPDITVSGDQATLDARRRVAAAVFPRRPAYGGADFRPPSGHPLHDGAAERPGKTAGQRLHLLTPPHQPLQRKK